MLKPRKIDGVKDFYFSTNTSSIRVARYRDNPKASIYFYHKGLIKYEGVMLIGTMEVLEDAAIKQHLWQIGDKMFCLSRLKITKNFGGNVYGFIEN